MFGIRVVNIGRRQPVNGLAAVARDIWHYGPSIFLTDQDSHSL